MLGFRLLASGDILYIWALCAAGVDLGRDKLICMHWFERAWRLWLGKFKQILSPTSSAYPCVWTERAAWGKSFNFWVLGLRWHWAIRAEYNPWKERLLLFFFLYFQNWNTVEPQLWKHFLSNKDFPELFGRLLCLITANHTVLDKKYPRTEDQ